MGNIISDLASGAASGLFSGIGALAKDIRVAITGIDPEKQAELEEKLLALESTADEAQSKINEIEAANPRVFVSGWRPFVGWVCGSALAYNFVLSPFLQMALLVFHSEVKLPALDMTLLMPVLLGMMGLRSFEKYRGIDTK